MIAETPKPLPEALDMPCYVCEAHPATHVCRYKLGELAVQVCLCGQCMQMDTQRLLEQTIGIQESVERPSGDHLVFDALKLSASRQIA